MSNTQWQPVEYNSTIMCGCGDPDCWRAIEVGPGGITLYRDKSDPKAGMLVFDWPQAEIMHICRKVPAQPVARAAVWSVDQIYREVDKRSTALREDIPVVLDRDDAIDLMLAMRADYEAYMAQAVEAIRNLYLYAEEMAQYDNRLALDRVRQWLAQREAGPDEI